MTKSSPPKAQKLWVIVSPKGRVVLGCSMKRDKAWVDAVKDEDDCGIFSHHLYCPCKLKKAGYRALQVTVKIP